MPTIARGNTAEIYSPIYSSLTFTPGAGGALRLSFACQSGDPAIAPQFVQEATTVSVTAGTTVFAEAINTDATYTDPAGRDGSLQSLVSEAGNITAAELLTTTGTTGQVVRLSDGPDRGALLIWSTPEGATTETWCWWLWPQASYL